MQKRTPAEVLRLVKDEGVEIVDFRFFDLPGLMQHFSVPAHELTEDGLRGGLRLRRLVDPGLPGDPGVGHAPAARPQHGGARPVPPAQDPEHQLLRPRPGHRRVLLAATPATSPRRPRTTWSRPGIADTGYFGPEAEFFIFDDVRFAQDQRSAFYQVDSVEGHLELGQGREPQPRLQDPLQGGLLPGPPDGPLPGPALGDDPHHGAARHRDRGPAPRGGHRRPGRDRHALRHPAAHGRQADALQVRREERGPCGRLHRHLHAQAALPGQRLGHALPPVAVEGRRSRCSTPRPATPASRTWAAGTSAACSSTPGHPGLRRPDHQLLQAARSRATRRR